MQVGKFLKNIKRAGQNRSVGRNKHAGGKILKKHQTCYQSKAVQGDFFLKINNRAGQIPIHMQYAINVQRGIFFLKINKHADQNKAVQGGIFS